MQPNRTNNQISRQGKHIRANKTHISNFWAKLFLWDSCKAYRMTSIWFFHTSYTCICGAMYKYIFINMLALYLVQPVFHSNAVATVAVVAFVNITTQSSGAPLCIAKYIERTTLSCTYFIKWIQSIIYEPILF